MKYKILVSVCLIIFCTNSFSQSLANKTQREYFILGTLSDYIGRYLDPRDTDLVDRYDRLQGPLVDVLDSILKIDYANSEFKVKRYTDTDGKPIGFKIFSHILFTKLNDYYTFKPSGSMTTEGDPILMGLFKDSIFKTKEAKLAFLAGPYVRFGIPNDTSYVINIGNSLSKALMCYRLLIELKCKSSYRILKNNIPVIYDVYFHPTPQVKDYLQRFMYLRKNLNDNLIAFIENARADNEKRKKESRH